ncbi:ABC transporter ATP-binding protein, partial [Belliella pelovolcani]|uniref:ABC transporter ATP-binding protein n=1 Tax=Belliella pelovolcani TaxID=529505 RepID=UPI00391A4FC1
RAAASQTRINEFLDEKNDIISSEGLDIPIKGKIEVKNVSFTYPESGIKALYSVSFDIDSGESLAIIGTTGSGKSTIANLLMRMYDVSEGEIYIDGHEIEKFDTAALRRQIGFVPQDVFLFSDSISNNIGFGLDQIPRELVEKAAKDADVYDNIIAFPKGFQTRLGERGITLSGGQKQRVSIARAIAKEPSILLLDDCLSAVDTKTENAILNALSKIMVNRTSVIISHRVSSAKLADKIIVLDDGKLVEQGSHEELMAKKGVYAELYEKQTQINEPIED